MPEITNGIPTFSSMKMMGCVIAEFKNIPILNNDTSNHSQWGTQSCQENLILLQCFLSRCLLVPSLSMDHLHLR